MTDLLLEIYMDKLTIPPVELDEFGRPLGEAPPDPWESRAGVGAALQHLAPLMSLEVCIKVYKFFIPQGILYDRSRLGGRKRTLLPVPCFGEFIDRYMESYPR